MAERLSDRAKRVATALRERAADVERVTRFGREPAALSDGFVEDFNELLRRLHLRMVYRSQISDLNSATPEALREEAASLEEIAAAIRGTTPFRLDRSELSGCGLIILLVATTGALLLWFRYAPPWVGIMLTGAAVVMTGVIIAMHHDAD